MYIFLLLAGILASVGCQSLDVNIPAARIESPESPGKRKFTIGGTGVAAGAFSATSNAGERPPDLTDTALSGSLQLGPFGEYGFTDRLSTALEAGFGGTDASFFMVGKIKYQFFGSTWAEKKVGPQLSVWGRLGTGNGTESGEQKVVFGGGGYPWSGSITDTMAGAGASFGYRSSEKILLYAGIAADKHNLPGSADRIPKLTSKCL